MTDLTTRRCDEPGCWESKPHEHREAIGVPRDILETISKRLSKVLEHSVKRDFAAVSMDTYAQIHRIDQILKRVRQ